jgi:hypothetical protein
VIHTARWCRALLVAGPLSFPVEAARAQEPAVPVERTLSGGSLIVLGTTGFNAPMLAFRGTRISRELAAPDLTLGVYLHNSAELVDVDLGIGGYVPVNRTGALTLTVGPSLLVGVSSGATSAAIGLQGKVGLVLPFDLNLGVRRRVRLVILVSLLTHRELQQLA